MGTYVMDLLHAVGTLESAFESSMSSTQECPSIGVPLYFYTHTGSTFSLDDRLCHNFGNAICTASWNHNPDTWSQYSAAVGLETGEVYIIAGICQLERRVIWCRSRKKSSVFSVAFSGKVDHCTRKSQNIFAGGGEFRGSCMHFYCISISWVEILPMLSSTHMLNQCTPFWCMGLIFAVSLICLVAPICQLYAQHFGIFSFADA